MRLDGSGGLGEAGGFGILRLRLSRGAARAFAQDDRLMREWARSRFLAALGMESQKGNGKGKGERRGLKMSV